MDTITWISTHWDDIIITALAVIGAASAIAKLTPTPKDDAVLAKILVIIEALALNKPKSGK